MPRRIVGTVEANVGRATTVQGMEAARLNFINTAKKHVIGSRSRLERPLIHRSQSSDVGLPAQHPRTPSPAAG